MAYWIVATSQSHTYSIRLCLPVNSLLLLCVRAHGYSFVNVCVFCLFISFYARCYALLQGCNHILTNANKTVFFKKIRFFWISTNEEAPTLNAHQNIFFFLQNYRQSCWNRQAHIVSYCQQRKIKFFFSSPVYFHWNWIVFRLHLSIFFLDINVLPYVYRWQHAMCVSGFAWTPCDACESFSVLYILYIYFSHWQ